MSTKGSRSYRPEFHYTPPAGWINDPNGLTYEDGTWHLFAQHYPHDTVWGPMHWIHAVSSDLLHWEDRGIALSPDEKLGMIFSGSAVIDEGNTSGLGTDADPMVCMYTSHGEHEQQSIAFSDDRVRFTPYAGNPVIPNTRMKDFRDPKVFRNPVRNCWTVVIAAGDHVEFHASPDLIHWRKTGEFGCTENKLGGIFECPDLFPLTAPDGEELWVLIASMALPFEFGGSRTQYFIGRFDGDTFIETLPSDEIKLVDSGYDNYAAVTFSGAPEPILLGWGASWVYAADMPTNEFCGVMTCARRLSLVDTRKGFRLAFSPIVPAFAYKAAEHNKASNPRGVPSASALLSGEQFAVRVAGNGPFTLTIKNEHGEALRVSIDNEQRFVVDRTYAGKNDFNSLYSTGLFSTMITPRLKDGAVTLDFFFDRMIAEIFADDGTFANTVLVFPEHPYTHVILDGFAQLSVGAPD